MERDSGGLFRALRRDIGGLPAWGIILLAVLALGTAGVLMSGLMPRTAVKAYHAPPAAERPRLPTPQPLAVFLGDSYTQGVGGGGVTWPGEVSTRMGWQVANYALGGTGYLTTAGESGCGRAHCGTYAEASKEIFGSPAYIVVAGGRNDLRQSPTEFAAAADGLFKDLRERYPDAMILAISPWFDDDPAPSALSVYAAAVATAAAANGVYFLDTGQPLLGQPNLVIDDGVHPNANGYRALADATLRSIEAVLAG